MKKNLKSSFPRKLKLCICNTSPPRALDDLDSVNQIIEKNPLRIVTLSLYSNKISSLNSEQVFYPIQPKTCLNRMNFIKANVCKTCTCGDRLKPERVLFWFVHKLLSNSLIHKSFLWFQHMSTKESYDKSRIL